MLGGEIILTLVGEDQVKAIKGNKVVKDTIAARQLIIAKDIMTDCTIHHSNIKNKGMNNTRRDEQSSEASNQATSDIFKNVVPEKMTDSRSFTIPCLIGGMNHSRTLCNLGASINLMPLSIFQKLEMEEVPTYSHEAPLC
ncbi:uncharacterized protein E5676_scaffold172G001020 [Cucumis melo var. makuwa]|uniref:Uncharacterized protein n=1 Tax=Cucumis melo var. makuwa TaxID=1194695 RepID=A0A5A7U0K6_CUCMM|nr:uncharacterized protein E6C27_scaffold43G00360 [Cucumis melo var. makuwa]TYK31597.1 uncharacterized protein E5676_scaffold172G001020 [Cucumis melo var. makuwa]